MYPCTKWQTLIFLWVSLRSWHLWNLYDVIFSCVRRMLWVIHLLQFSFPATCRMDTDTDTDARPNPPERGVADGKAPLTLRSYTHTQTPLPFCAKGSGRKTRNTHSGSRVRSERSVSAAGPDSSNKVLKCTFIAKHHAFHCNYSARPLIWTQG